MQKGYLKQAGEAIYLRSDRTIEPYVLQVGKKLIQIFIYNNQGLYYTLYIGFDAVFTDFTQCINDKSIIDKNTFDVSNFFDINLETKEECEELQDDWNGLTKFIISKCESLNLIK